MEEQKKYLVPIKKLIAEDNSTSNEFRFEVIPALRKRIRDEKGKMYLNPYNLSDWLPNAFIEYIRKVHEQ